MAESSIIEQKEGIKYIAGQKLVALGVSASKRYCDGREAKNEREEGVKIIKLLKSLRNELELTSKEQEAILFCLRSLAQEYEIPAYPNVVTGQKPTYLIGTQGPPGPPGPDGNGSIGNVVSDDTFDNINVQVEVLLGVQTFKLGYDPYIETSPSVTVTSGKKHEQGTVPTIAITFANIKGREPLVSRTVTPGTITLDAINTWGNVYSQNINYPESVNTDFILQVTDGLNAVSDEDSVEFFYPYLHGNSDDIPPTLDPYLLGGKIIDGQINQIVLFNGTNKYFYFGYPNDFPDLVAILDQNSDDVTDAFEKLTPTVDGTSVKNVLIVNNWSKGYKLYKTKWKTTITNKPYTFKFTL